MNVKLILYLIIIPFTIWCISSLKIETLFKKNSINQIKIFYLFFSLSLSYLFTNFIFDIYQIFSLIN